MRWSLTTILTLTASLLTACASSPMAAPPAELSVESRAAAPPRTATRLVAGIRSAPPTMVDYLQSAGSYSGASHMVRLASSGLTWTNDQGVRVPQARRRRALR